MNSIEYGLPTDGDQRSPPPPFLRLVSALESMGVMLVSLFVAVGALGGVIYLYETFIQALFGVR